MTKTAEGLSQEVVDRLAIQHVINTYVWAMDDGEYDLMDDIFQPDATFDLSAAGGPIGTWTTGIKDNYIANAPLFEHIFHSFTNVLISFGPDGETAVSRSKVTCPSGFRDANGTMHFMEMLGEYRDSWIRTDEGWRITGRKWFESRVWGDNPFATRDEWRATS